MKRPVRQEAAEPPPTHARWARSQETLLNEKFPPSSRTRDEERGSRQDT